MEINLGLRCAMTTEKGRRSANEDYIALDEANGLYIVADGAGGEAGGRTAATLAVKTTMEALAQQLSALEEAEPTQTTGAIDAAVQSAHKRIREAQAAQPELHRMSTTLALALHRGQRLHYTHVGDSRIYLHRNGALRQLSRDHSLKNHLEDNPHVRRPVQMSGKTLVRAIGVSGKPVKADHDHLTLELHDVILMCTDGLTDAVPPWVLGEILGGASVVSATEVATSLTRAALRYGSTDNVSVVVLQVVEAASDDVRTKVHEPEPSLGQEPPVPQLGWLIETEGPQRGKLMSLEKSNTVGVNPSCMIRLEDKYMSDQHAEIFLTKHGYVLRDLGSTNGTFINNIRIKEECLVDGDVVRFGTSSVVFKCYHDHR